MHYTVTFLVFPAPCLVCLPVCLLPLSFRIQAPFRLPAIAVDLRILGPSPMATMLIPSPFRIFTMPLTASGSDGSPSVSVMNMSGPLCLQHGMHLIIYFCKRGGAVCHDACKPLCRRGVPLCRLWLYGPAYDRPLMRAECIH